MPIVKLMGPFTWPLITPSPGMPYWNCGPGVTAPASLVIVALVLKLTETRFVVEAISADVIIRTVAVAPGTMMLPIWTTSW